jgi:hypothetical protein
MSLNRDDSIKLNYKADIGWYKKRLADLQKGFYNPVVKDTGVIPDNYRSNLKDLSAKIEKLNDRVDYISQDLRIPIDQVKDQEIYRTVLAVDPDSGGNYITYDLYKELVEKVQAGEDNIKLDDLIDNSSNDDQSSSLLIQDRIYAGYAGYLGVTSGNTYSENVTSYSTSDYQSKQIISFADNFLAQYSDPKYIAWNFKQDLVSELSQCDSFYNTWNSFSSEGSGEVVSFGGVFSDLSPLDPDINVTNLTNRYISYTNSYLNDINDLFNYSWGAEALCCFLKFSVNLDTKTLRALISMLQLLQAGMNVEFSDLLKSVKDVLKNFIRNIIINQLLNIMIQAEQRMFSQVEQWISKAGTDSGWNKVFECLPVKVLIDTYIAKAIYQLNRHLSELILEKYKDLETQKIYKDAKIKVSSDNQWIGRVVKVLSTVAIMMELSAQCGIENSANAESVQRVITDYGLGGSTYIYPESKNPNIYNSFITAEQQAAIAEGKDTVSSVETVNQTSNIEKSSKGGISECLKNISSDDMPTPIIWK